MRPITSLAALLLVPLAALHAAAAPKPASKPNIFILLADWKLINQLGSGGFSKPSLIKPQSGDPAGQLYNLRNDLAETDNRYLKHPEIVARLEAEMQRIKAVTQARPQPIKRSAHEHEATR